MTKSLPLTATIITLNEAEDLPRALESLAWVNEVIVVDSGSTDQTVEIAESFGARVIVNRWPGYGQQKNFAMTHAANDWVLNIDADEMVTQELRQSIQSFLQSRDSNSEVWGARFARRSFFGNHWIKYGGWYPNFTTRLSHRKYSRWTEPSVHETLVVDSSIETLPGDLNHYTFKNVGDQVRTNIRYAVEGAKQKLENGQKSSLLKICCKPVGKFWETYAWKRGFLDGLPGLIISINAAHSIFMKYVELYYLQNRK